MLRALAKGSALAAFGRVPRGPALYRDLTRRRLGTAASHVVKLQRVWPEYAMLWPELCGIELEGSRLWVHEAGATPFSALAAYALTGRAAWVTNTTQPLLNRTLARSVNAVLRAGFDPTPARALRLAALEAVRWQRDAVAAVTELGGAVHVGVAASRLPLPGSSARLCCSGGALEHYRPDELDGFLRECFRVLEPGGVASHVFDHRDHLYHADKRLPFMAHLALSDPVYQLLLGHPLAFHNRLSPTEVAQRFDAAGFERIAIRRLVLPRQAFVSDEEVLSTEPDLNRRLLAPRFRAISDADLRTAAAHYLYRKPG